MELTVEKLEDVIYKAINFYNGFLEPHEIIRVTENMYLDERSKIDETHFAAILVLVETYLRNNMKVNMCIDRFGKETQSQNTVKKLAKYLHLTLHNKE